MYKVHENPGIAFYADPWALHQKGLIRLESESSYRGFISKSAPIMLAQDSASPNIVSTTNEIYNGLDIISDQIRLIELELNDDSEIGRAHV